MKSFISFTSVIIATITLCLSVSCNKKKKEDAPDYDRTSMLTNIGNNIIIPNYQALYKACNKLDSAISDFNSNPDNTRLLNLQTIFKDTYVAWQLCSSFEFGPAELEHLASLNINVFPLDTTQVNSNITSGSYNMEALSNKAAKGFPAMDYLLFGKGTDNNDILLKYTTDSKAANTKLYLDTVSANITIKVKNVLNSWLPGGGNYINTFIHASGTDMGSSTGLLVNQLNYDLEILKNFKVGIPSGKQSLGTIYPNKVEALYSGISVELALLQLQTLENIFLGKSTQGDGPGFDDYLNQIGAQYGSGLLSTAIKNQFATTISKLQALPDPLASALQSNPTVADAAYLEIQKLVVILKTDMASAMAVLITYNDNDGD